MATTISSTSCGDTYGSSNGISTDSYHCASVSGIGTSTVHASVTAIDRTPYTPALYSISDWAFLDVMLYTDGPVRDGFLRIDATNGGEFGYVSISAGPWQCSGQSDVPVCFSNGSDYIPVTLGTPFEFSMSVSYSRATGSAVADLQLSLNEAFSFFPGGPLYPGAPVDLLGTSPAGSPVSDSSTPEPASMAMLLAGAGMIFRKARPR